MEDAATYLERKSREIALIDGCLAESLRLPAAASATEVIERKFRLAAALRAERSLQSWAITETARPEVQRWRYGAYEFSFGYQRADLQVRGPSIYGMVDAPRDTAREEVVYTGSGMSAIAVVVTALLRQRGDLEVIAPRGCYGETRELLESLGSRVTIVPYALRKRPSGPTTGGTRILLLDSCVASGFDDYRDASPRAIDLLIFDTTCFWQDSSRIRIAVDWAMQSRVPVVLVRSHAKLDSLGIEYGRLGSVVLHWNSHEQPHRWMKELFRATGDSVRLYGAAALPAHFPPFTGTDRYRAASRARTAAIIRNTRRMARALSSCLSRRRSVRQFQHGQYFALVPGKDLRIKDVKRAADALCGALSRQGLPVRHAGSFGFDFVAMEWFFDAILRRNVIRVAGADLPAALIDRIVDAIDAWWSDNRMSAPQKTPEVVAATQEATAS